MSIKKVKQGISLRVALAYLYGLSANAKDLFEDAEYYRAFKALEQRVCDMLETPYDGDIIDEYVIVEQEDIGQVGARSTTCYSERGVDHVI